MSKPTTTPTNTARKNPAASLPRLKLRLAASLPLASSFHQAARMRESGGIKVESMTRPATSHKTARDRIDNALAPSRLFMVVVHGVFEAVPDVVGQFDELGIGPDLVGIAWPLKRHVEHFRHLARPRRHHHHPIRKINRLVHAVGDKNHCLALALPELQQFFLQELAGLGIDGTERLFHE